MTKVSVIIATYKAEPYIERCARSLFGQTLADMEFIFVDDCSPDRSIEVMQRVLADYPERAGQVKIIRHERNLGVSATRQDGVDAATGLYAIHCDPDDWVDAEMYQTLLDAAEANMADMVICDFYGSGHTSGAPERLTAIEMLESIAGVSHTSRHGGMCNKLIKMSLLHNARFPRAVSYGEDSNYLFQVLRNQDMRIVDLHKPLYHYEYNPISISRIWVKDEIERDYENILTFENMKSNATKQYCRCIDSMIFSLISQRIFISGVYDNKEFRAKFGRFAITIRSNSSCPRIRAVLTWMSIKGVHRQSLFMFNRLWQVKRTIRNLTSLLQK